MKSKTFFTAGLVLVLLFNVAELASEISDIKEKKRQFSFYFPGIKFSGLETILGDIERVGYYTDKDLNNKAHAAEFAQAQYILAPVILDAGNTGHSLILFNCTTEEAALKKMKEIRATPYKKNQFGIYLAKK